MKPATERQLKYLNILLDRCFKNQRKLYLDIFYHKNSSKNLSLLEASEIIEKFVDENPNKDKNIGEAMQELLKKMGQKTLI